MSQQSLDKLRKRAYASQQERLKDVVETGGWKTIFGEKRFIPLGAMLRKPRHCTSCLHFRLGIASYCKATGSYTNKDADACGAYLNRTYKTE